MANNTFYTNGIIAIPNVTGDIEITISAVQTAEDNFIVFSDCTATVDSPTGAAVDSVHASKDTENNIFVTHYNRNGYGNIMWSSDELKALPAGKYRFSGEFKQDAADASAIAIFNGTARMFKNSLNVGNVWTSFSYEFELTNTGVIGFMAINDSATGGDAYLRNAKIIQLEAYPVSMVNKMVVQESNLNKRISGTSVASMNGCFIADPIAVDLTKSCPVTFKNFASTMGTLGDGTLSYSNSKVMLLDASKNALAVWYIAGTGYNAGWACPVSRNDCVGDLASIFDYNPTAGTKPDAASVAYVQFAPQISTSEITMDSLSGMEILMEG